MPLLRDQLPKDVAERVIDVRLDVRAPEANVLGATVAALRESDHRTDREKVEALLDAYRANGLGVVGVERTRAALELGQVDELLISATPDAIDAGAAHAGDVPPERTHKERAADDLVIMARQTAARISFIEDATLLAPVGGVGALLRFRADNDAR